MVVAPAVEKLTLGLHSIEQYEPLIGGAVVDRILAKAKHLGDRHFAHISSTFYGGGVTEILTPLSLLLNAVGIATSWHLIQGTPAFFNCTKKLHNGLQGQAMCLLQEEKAIYEQLVFENALRLHVEACDAVVVHDPQPLPLIRHFSKRATQWLWQCHVDLTAPNDAVWRYLSALVEQYDVAIFSLPEYAQTLAIRQHFIAPAIDPFSPKNADLSEQQIDNCLLKYDIPTARPLITQISRFDRWKDPMGVIEAFRIARAEIDCTLVLLGNNATDDPEAAVILGTIMSAADEGIIVLTDDNPVLVNALQRRAAVVLQKSTREGFGLTVTEAMWKGAVVVGGDVGGIRRQIVDGENGFLVRTVGQAAERIVQVLKDSSLRQRMGARARESVRENFLMSRLLEDWLDLLSTKGPART
jgi:trehalose synthase